MVLIILVISPTFFFFSMKKIFFSKIFELKMTFSTICVLDENFHNSTFLSFSLLVDQLRPRMVMWLVSIESPDVFEPKSWWKLYIQALSTHFFSKTYATCQVKKAFLSLKSSLWNMNFKNATFLSFSLLVDRLRPRMVMWLVSIKSIDGFESKSW